MLARCWRVGCLSSEIHHPFFLYIGPPQKPCFHIEHPSRAESHFLHFVRGSTWRFLLCQLGPPPSPLIFRPNLTLHSIGVLTSLSIAFGIDFLLLWCSNSASSGSQKWGFCKGGVYKIDLLPFPILANSKKRFVFAFGLLRASLAPPHGAKTGCYEVPS